MEEKGCDHGKNREASSFGGETELGDAESESSGEGVEMVMSEADDTEVENISFISWRAIPTTSRAGSSVHSEGLADAPATSDNFSHGPDQQFAALRAGEAKRLAEHILGPLRTTIFKGRTRAEEGDARCIMGGLIREAFAIRYNYLCFSRFQYVPKFSRENLNSGPELRLYLYYW